MSKSNKSIPVQIIPDIARGRLDDARVLFEKSRHDGAFYLCGYAVELALKYRICRTLNWREYPSANVNSASFKVHDLEELLYLSGYHGVIIDSSSLENAWDAVKLWSSENRYRKMGEAQEEDVRLMVNSVDELLRKLL